MDESTCRSSRNRRPRRSCPLAEARGITIETVGDLTPTVGSPTLLLQLTTNLVHNAIVHNLPEGGRVWVTTRVQPKVAELTVENTGAILSPATVPTLVEPFQRGAERTRTDDAGVGLGLAIVRSITQAHDGTLTLTPRAGGGLRVTVELPRKRHLSPLHDATNERSTMNTPASITVTPVFVADLHVEGERMPIYVHVIDHPDGRVLVDTGMTVLHPLLADMEPRLTPLSEQDLDLAGIDIVVNTHLHADHCGGNHLFAGRPIYVQRRELDDARSQDDYTIREWVDAPGVRYVPVDGELELLPGIRLVPAPGHTPGTQVVVVETGGRPIVIGGDMAVWFGELDEPSTEGQLLVRALDPETGLARAHARAVATPDGLGQPHAVEETLAHAQEVLELLDRRRLRPVRADDDGHDLVADLERHEPEALARRRTPDLIAGAEDRDVRADQTAAGRECRLRDGDIDLVALIVVEGRRLSDPAG